VLVLQVLPVVVGGGVASQPHADAFASQEGHATQEIQMLLEVIDTYYREKL
jgi:hypothetical protein